MARNPNKIRVLIVDDSALVRRLLTEMLSGDSGIEVVGSAPDPYVARERIKRLAPDVITLDVEMPRMDGITFLRNLMRLRPMPVVMVSSLTERGAAVTLDALELGAVDFVAKPKVDLAQGLQSYAEEIRAKVKAAAAARVQALDPFRARGPKVTPRLSADAVLARRPAPIGFRTTERIIGLGASTGGTEAIKEVLLRLPADAPGIVISQHIPAAFSAPFAARMNACSAMVVREASDGEQVLPGHAYIAPGDWHLLVERSGARYHLRLDQGSPVNRHRPSVDVMVRSLVQSAGANAVGALLTGMGADGAQGLLELRQAGAPTAAQDEHSAVVWGMPGEAVRIGATGTVLPLSEIADWIMHAAADGAAPGERSLGNG